MSTVLAETSLTQLAARSRATTAYRRYTFDPNPMISGRRETSLTVTEATSLTRKHFADYPVLRSIRAQAHGAVTLLEGNRHILLEPGSNARPSLLTLRQADDLILITEAGSRAKVVVKEGRGAAIHAGLHRIPPAACARLVEHGWIATTGQPGARVEVSLAGTVALAWRHCKTFGVPQAEWETEIAEAVYGAYCS